MRRICIVGGGPAGLSLADTLISREPTLQIVILEAGGEKENFAEAAEFVSVGSTPYAPIRQFMLGGHGHLWGGACPRLNPGDFSMRSQGGVYLDWPIAYEELMPYYQRAEELLQVEPRDLDGYLGSVDLDPVSEAFQRAERLGVLPYGNREYFVNEVLPRVMNGDVEIRTRCVVRNIELLKAGGARVHYYASDKRLTHVDTDIIVLAAGGLSNARLLQLSRSERFPDGIGNQHGNLGLYHMDHPRVLVTLRRRDVPVSASPGQDAKFFPGGGLSFRKTVSDGDPEISYASLSDDVTVSADVAEQSVEELLAGLEAVDVEFMSRLRALMKLENSLALDFEAMEPPLATNRLTLSDEVDLFGDPKLATDINIDEKRVQIFNALIDDVKKLYSPHGYEFVGFRASGWTGQHPSGSTRMTARAEDGVVDRDLKVFGTDNVYVLGSSVFTTAGYANPTLTILALSLRLADHLVS